jgi:dTDP-4-dehydrorhamnose 3,5-epimerase
MEVIEAGLPGLKIIQPKVFRDPRGFFLETYNSQRYRDAGIPDRFVQDNVSLSAKGILRGLHFQKPSTQGKLVTVLKGEVFDVAVDIRVGSPTFGKWFGLRLNEESLKQLWIPAGFAHGFVVTSEVAIFSYKCDAFYKPEAEYSILWNDPDIGIEWPELAPTLSRKDENGKLLRDFKPNELPAFVNEY